jgi:outer membrane immunogenic protein
MKLKTVTYLISLLLAVLACSHATYAADIYRAPTTGAICEDTCWKANWTGIWIAGDVGYGQSNTEVSAGYEGVEYFNFNGLSGMGGVFGVSAGGDFQIGKLILGGGAGYDWNFIESSASFDGESITLENGNQYYLQGRVGVAATNSTAIFALLRYVWQDGAEVNGAIDYKLEDRQGWGVGVEFETAMTENVFIRGQYVHTTFGEEEYSLGDGFIREDTTTDVGKIGIVYKFGIVQ